MKIKFDLSVDAWIKNIEIEAISPEQAYQRLLDMSVGDLIQEGSVDADAEYSQIDGELLERNLQVSVYNIVYRDDDFVPVNDSDVSRRVLELPKRLHLSVRVNFDGPYLGGLNVVKNGNPMSEAALDKVTADAIYSEIKDELENLQEPGIKVVSFEYAIVEEFDY